MSCCSADGTCVCATLIASGAVDGDETMYGRSASLPAAATTTTPSCDATLLASDKSSSICPYAEPSDMLMTSTASETSPSPFGSSASSIACSNATPLHDVAIAL